MASSQQSLKSLEDRAEEIETLKRALQQSEKERKLLESQRRSYDSKQPADAQALLAQKRELQTQLEREESEKHELFAQINQLIGEIAELRSNVEVDAFRAQLAELTAENEELKKDFGRKEAEFQRLSDDILTLRNEFERRERTHQLEKSRLTDEIHDCQTEIELKTAALQSLKLAKQSSNDAARLMAENETLRQELQEKEDLLRELTESNDELGRSLTECGGQMDALRAELTNGRERASRTDDELEALKKRLEHEKTERRIIEEYAEKLKAELALKSDNILPAPSLAVDVKQIERNAKEAAGQEFRGDLARIMESLKQAKTDLNVKDVEIGKLRNRLHQQEEDLDQLSAELKRVRLSVEEDATASESRTDELIGLRTERDRLAYELAERSRRLAEQEAAVEALERKFQLRDAEETERAAERQAEAEVHRRRVSALEARNTDYQLEMKALCEDLKKYRAEAKDAFTKLSFAESSVERLDAERSDFFHRLTDALELPSSLTLSADGNEHIFSELRDLKVAAATGSGDAEAWRTRALEADTSVADMRHRLDEAERARHVLEISAAKQEDEVRNFTKNAEQMSGVLAEESKRNAHLLMEAEELRLARDRAETDYRQSHADLERCRQDLLTLDQLTAENRRLTAEVADLRATLTASERRIDELERHCQGTAVNGEGKAASADGGGDVTALNQKIMELMDENAQLAGDLLKQESCADQQYRAALTQERDKWAAERDALTAELKRAHDVAETLRQQLENEKRNLEAVSPSPSEPVPKPRRSAAATTLSLENGGSENSTNASELSLLKAAADSSHGLLTTTPSSAVSSSHSSLNDATWNTTTGGGGDADSEMVSRLRAELDKQKRLVTVLRKKLQAGALDSATMSRTASRTAAATH